MKGGGKKRSGAGNLVQSEALEGNNGDEGDAKKGGVDVSNDQFIDDDGVHYQSQENGGQEKGEDNSGREEEEQEEEEEEEEEGEEEVKGVGGGGGGEEEALKGEEAQDERPKLDDGFFEIEAIRRKRVRKGQLQYLIKWRGWPETANTWEPLENLQSCSDVIDAFEESLQSGKHGRKRKRKYGGPHTQPKKKQPRGNIAAYNVKGIGSGIVDKTVPSAPLNNLSLADLPALNPFIDSGHVGENNGGINDVRTANRVEENGSSNFSKQIDERKEENEYDPKLSELKGTVCTNEVNADKLAIHFQEGKTSEGDGHTNGLPKVDSVEPVQSSRCTGAKRRKSFSVKRFKQDPASSEPVITQNSTPNCGGTVAQLGIGNPGLTGDASDNKSKIDDSMNASPITKILKPISFSASVSDNIQDALVTFMAIRSDGKEVIVDNRFLKANNPLLLINFYEQHLKYSPTP